MKLIKELFSWLTTLAAAIAFAILISVFLIQPTKVLGHSMNPTLHNNEIVYVSKLLHTFHQMPDYEDIVIIDSRVNRKHTWVDDLADNPLYNLVTGHEDHDTWIKRVIGKPGDVLEFKNHHVYRNGKQLTEPYVKEVMQYTSNTKIIVPANYVYVMGDNRNNSTDSRVIGVVPLDHVLGKMIF